MNWNFFIKDVGSAIDQSEVRYFILDSLVSTFRAGCLGFSLVLLLSGCIIEEVTDEDPETANQTDGGNVDPIVGKWFLVEINDQQVDTIDCYKDFFIESDGKKITFFIEDRLQNGNCETVNDMTWNLKIEDGFYYLGDEVMDLYIEEDEMTWRVNKETELVFEKS